MIYRVGWLENVDERGMCGGSLDKAFRAPEFIRFTRNERVQTTIGAAGWRHSTHFGISRISGELIFTPIDRPWSALQSSYLVQYDRTKRVVVNSRKLRESAPSLTTRMASAGLLRPNAWSDRIGLKRLLIEHSKSYRSMCMVIEIEQSWPSKNFLSGYGLPRVPVSSRPDCSA